MIGLYDLSSATRRLTLYFQLFCSSCSQTGATHDKSDEAHKAAAHYSPAQLFAMEKEAFLTVALCMQSGIVVYTMCTEDFRGVKTYELLHDQQVYLNDIGIIKAPDVNSVNYSSVRSSHQDGPPGYNLVRNSSVSVK